MGKGGPECRKALAKGRLQPVFRKRRWTFLPVSRYSLRTMKSNSLSAVLLGVLAISALASVVLCLMYVSGVRELRNLQGQVAAVQGNRVLATQLAADLMEYSKRNKEVIPLLESVGFKAPSTQDLPPQVPALKNK